MRRGQRDVTGLVTSKVEQLDMVFHTAFGLGSENAQVKKGRKKPPKPKKPKKLGPVLQESLQNDVVALLVCH